MDDFDLFTDEINFSKPFYMDILNKYVKDLPATPSGPNYHCSRKLIAEESLAAQNEMECAFHFSESVSALLRIMAVYRDDQLRTASNQLKKITSFIKPVGDLIDSNPVAEEQDDLLDILSGDTEEVTSLLKQFELGEAELPFHKEYLKFGAVNNVDNFQKILKELPEEWTVIQLTAPYNPNENLKPLDEYRTEIDSVYLTMFSNDYLHCGNGPLTVNIPAYVTKEGEKPLFTELYSLLDENYKTIDNAPLLNNKRLVQNYWYRREDIDLRMKSVITVMDKEWLGGFSSLLTGKLVDSNLRDRVVQLVDNTINDWGFIKLTTKQKILLYNLIESSPNLASPLIKSCIRKILTEHGDTEEVRRILNNDCQTCTKEFRFINELCFKCLAKCFEKIHHFELTDGVKAFSEAANVVKDSVEWAVLKKTKRYPVILIVDEMLDTFPWETMPILSHQSVSRMENIHFLYYLYKTHEKDVTNGYFVTKADVGRYVINPEKNLDRMEMRMTSFVRYWCSSWTGYVGEPPPTPHQFIDCLCEADVFLFCGHGDGCRFANGGANGAGVEGAVGTRSVTILSGCGSVRLVRPEGRGGPQGAHHHLHIAGSPMVVGMLWEVTDLEVDKVVSMLVSLCVPSAAPRPWHSVGKAKWSHGVLDTKVQEKIGIASERDLLKAISRARGSTNYLMIGSSVVARGLPVRIRD